MMPRLPRGLLLASMLIPLLHAAAAARPAKSFIDYFLPIPARGPLTTEAWDAPGALPRDVRNGLAYDPRVDFVRYIDGTVNRWDKLERPGVVLDVPKQEEKGGDRHGNKVIVIPFDSAALDRDLADQPELPSSTTPAQP